VTSGVPTPPSVVQSWKKDAFAGPVTPDPQPNCPCLFHWPGHSQTPPPSKAALELQMPHPWWSYHMVPGCCVDEFFVLEFPLCKNTKSQGSWPGSPVCLVRLACRAWGVRVERPDITWDRGGGLGSGSAKHLPTPAGTQEPAAD
jgi:hypothetical protein